MQPLVSVIIPYYNQEAFLRETVQSVQDQTYRDIEIIVVDDGSARLAVDCLNGLEGICLLRQENAGCSAARNLGFTRSKGEYILFLDADDLLLPGAIQAHVHALEQNPGAGMSFGATIRIDEHGRLMRNSHICHSRKNYFNMMLQSNPVECPGGAMVRREAFVRAHMFDTQLSAVADHALYLNIALRYSIVRMIEPVVKYRQHSNSMSRNQDAMLREMLYSLEKFAAENPISPRQQRLLRKGCRRWTHVFHRKDTVGYKVAHLYYSVHALLTTVVDSRPAMPHRRGHMPGRKTR